MTDDDHTDDERSRERDTDLVDADVADDADGQPSANASSERGKVLTPEDLNISENEYVEELDDDGRFVVSPGESPPDVPRTDANPGRSGRGGTNSGSSGSEGRGKSAAPSPAGPRDAGQHDAPVSPEAARTLLATELERTNADYGVDVVARFGGETVRLRTASNDVVGTFEELVRWYARNVTDDTPVDEVVSILLQEANLAPETGGDRSLATLLDAHDLETGDSIADLVDAIREESGAGE